MCGAQMCQAYHEPLNFHLHTESKELERCEVVVLVFGNENDIYF